MIHRNSLLMKSCSLVGRRYMPFYLNLSMCVYSQLLQSSALVVTNEGAIFDVSLVRSLVESALFRFIALFIYFFLLHSDSQLIAVDVEIPAWADFFYRRPL